MKKIILAFLTALILGFCVTAQRSDISAVSQGVELNLSCESAILIESQTGEVLFSKNPDERLEPASVTKIMSLILVFEALDDGTLSLLDTVKASSRASSMGGSQIWLEEGEEMSVDDMIKAVTVVSANDCTVALAEHISGSEEAFVAKMNEKAGSLGMTNTSFSNSTGLPAENHYTTARDIAIMTRELLRREAVFGYTTIWLDSLRDGKTELANTNKLIRFYPGADGMKTGYTDTAKYCLSATAKRDDRRFIAVVMRSPSSNDRFEDAKKLLDFGFANFAVYTPTVDALPKVSVSGGTKRTLAVEYSPVTIITAKGREKQILPEIELPKKVNAPIAKGEVLGKIVYKIGSETVAEAPIVATVPVARAGFFDVILAIFRRTLSIS